MSRRNLFLLALVLALGSVVLISCAEQSGGEDGAFVLASPWEPTSVDPLVSGFVFTRLNIAETLIGVDYTGGLVPRLARSWETDADGLTWTLHLREDVRFHDGTSVDAEAVSLSLNRTFRADPLLSTLPVAAIGVAGEHTIIIETETPFSPLPGYLTSAATAILSPNSLNDEDEVQRPIATGPFKFESWKAREQITARRFDDYWGETAHLEKVVYMGIPDDKTRLSMLLSGEIHMARLLAPAALSRLEAEPNAEPVTRVRMGRVNQLMLNTDRFPLDDERVRRAVDAAIDRTAIASRVLSGVDEPASGPFSPGMAWANENLPDSIQDLDRSRELLDEAGWEMGDDGVRHKDGERLEAELYTYGSRPALPPTAEVIKDYLGQVGFALNVRVVEWAAMQSLAEEGRVDMCLMSRAIYSNHDPDSWARDFHPESSYFNYMQYSPPDVVDFIDAGPETVEQGPRRKIYDLLQARIAEDLPVIYLTYHTNIVGLSTDVRGYEEHPTEYSFHLERVWLED